MHLKRILLALMTGSILPVAGCAINEPTASATATATLSVRAEALGLLAQAEADVARARAKFALWTTAEQALLAAREAAQRRDDAETIRWSRIASVQAGLGIQQLDYPSTE